MKLVCTKKDWEKVIEEAVSQGVTMFTDEPGSYNMFYGFWPGDAGNIEVLKCWKTPSPAPSDDNLNKQELQVLAYGNDAKGGILLLDAVKNIIVDFGHGRGKGFAILAQRVDGRITVASFNDWLLDHGPFHIAAFENPQILAVVLSILIRFCPKISGKDLDVFSGDDEADYDL
jgi:hypothetical protein